MVSIFGSIGVAECRTCGLSIIGEEPCSPRARQTVPWQKTGVMLLRMCNRLARKKHPRPHDGLHSPSSLVYAAVAAPQRRQSEQRHSHTTATTLPPPNKIQVLPRPSRLLRRRTLRPRQHPHPLSLPPSLPPPPRPKPHRQKQPHTGLHRHTKTHYCRNKYHHNHRHCQRSSSHRIFPLPLSRRHQASGGRRALSRHQRHPFLPLHPHLLLFPRCPPPS